MNFKFSFCIFFALMCLLVTMLGKLCRAGTVLLAADGLYLHSTLHFYGRVPVEVSWFFTRQSCNWILRYGTFC